MPVATLALIVALCSFGIAAAALLWQILKHFLDGGRVRVYLNTAVYEPEFMVAVNRSGRFVLQPGNAATSVTQGKALEVAQLVVENPGKVPITIYSPGLDLSGHGEKKQTVVPRMYATTNGFGADSAITDTVVRLEPYGRVTFLLDYWSIVPGALKDAPNGQVYLRGFVEVAGRSGHPQKSSWRRRWRIEKGMYTAITGAPKFTPFAVMWKEIYGRLPERADNPDLHPNAGRPLTRGMLNSVMDEAMSGFDERPERDAFKDALDEIAKRYDDRFPILGAHVYWAYEALDRMQHNITTWTDGLFFHYLRNKSDTDATAEIADQATETDATDSDLKP